MLEHIEKNERCAVDLMLEAHGMRLSSSPGLRLLVASRVAPTTYETSRFHRIFVSVPTTEEVADSLDTAIAVTRNKRRKRG